MYNQRILSRAKFVLPFNSNFIFIRAKHVFKSSPWTLSQLEDHLIRTSVYDQGLVIANKPVGVSFEQGLVGSDSLNPGRDVCLKSALPAVKKHFNIDKLFNVKIPERNISGVTIFAENEDLVKEILKWWKVMREKKEEADVFHAIVVGKPHKEVGSFDGVISLKEKNGIKRIVLTEKIGRNAVKRREEKRVSFNHKVLASNDDASLVEVQASRAKWNSVRVYLATHTLTPVLGDELYGMYVKTLLGVPTPLDVFTKSILPPQKLPENLRTKLEISSRKDILVPLHLHLSSVRLMLNKKKIFEFSMPPPQVFNWTLDHLGLINNNQNLTASLAAA